MLDPAPAKPEAPDVWLRVALGFVRFASVLIPAIERRAWLSEWHAELITHAAAVGASTKSGPTAFASILWRAVGALPDALYITTHGFGLGSLVKDSRQAVRSLRKRPGFTTTAVLTLALGIGANTALFSVVRGVLLRPFPYEDPGRLVQLLGHREGAAPGSGNVSYPNLADLEDRVTGFRSVAGLSSWRPAVTEGDPLVLPGATVSWDYFGVLGVDPAAGRFFLEEDEGPGRTPVVVISHALWTGRFGRDPSLIGSVVSINNESHIVLGVAPPGFEGPHLISFEGEQPEIWRTPWFEASEWFRSGRSWKGVARLGEATPAATQAEVTAVMARLAETFPEENAQRKVTLRPLRESVVGDSRAALFLLLGAVGLVLLVACVNVATLLTGRMLQRRDELLVRNALGASRGRLISHLFAESFAVAVLGLGLGVLLAYWGVGAIVALAGTWLPRPEAIAVDASVLAFSSLLAGGTALFFGLVPALRTLREQQLGVVAGLRAGQSGGRRSRRWRRGLVLGQIAVSLVLVVGAGLLLQSFYHLHRVDLGVDREGLITMDLHGSTWWELDAEAATERYRQVLERAAAVPGVAVAGAIDVLPLADNHSCDGVTPLDRPPPAPGEGRCAEVRSVTPGALEALGTRVLDGRLIGWQDGPNSVGSMVVTQRTGDDFWPGESPLGKQALVHSDTFVVVGVVSDIRHFGPEEDASPMIFLPAGQEPWNGIARGLSLVVSGDRVVERMGSEIRAAVHEVDGSIAIERIRPMGDLLAARIGGPRLRTALLGVFAGLALLLALVGIAGVMTQSVARRRRELGIRLALGAAPGAATRLVIGEGARLTIVGLILGLLGATALTRVLRGFVFGVSALDTRTLFVGSVLVCGLSLLASWIPARRAARIDPVEALRSE